MKKVLLVILAMSLCLGLVGCGNKMPATETTAEQISESENDKRNLDDDEIETLLNGIFDLDGFQTMSTVSDGEATVYLSSTSMDNAYVQASTGEETAVEQWNELVALCLDLHNSAAEFLEQCSIETYKTVVSGKSFPYISIVNGEIELDFLNIGE